MNFKIKGLKIYVEYVVIIVLIVCLIISKIREYLANYYMCYLFVAFHEFSHMFVASLFGIKTLKLNVKISGMCINLEEKYKYDMKWILIYLAGPTANIILAILFKNIKIVFGINLALAATNLLPIYPLDGYYVLDIILNKNKVKNEKEIKKIILLLTGIIGVFIGVLQVIFYKNPSIIFMTIYVYIKQKDNSHQDKTNMYQKYYKNITKI